MLIVSSTKSTNPFNFTNELADTTAQSVGLT